MISAEGTRNLINHEGRALFQTDRYSDCLVRLPLFIEVDEKKVIEIMING